MSNKFESGRKREFLRRREFESRIRDGCGEYAAALFLRFYDELSEGTGMDSYVLLTPGNIRSFESFFGYDIKQYEDSIRKLLNVDKRIYDLKLDDYERLTILNLLEKVIGRREELILGFKEEFTILDKFEEHTLGKRFDAYRKTLMLFRIFVGDLIYHVDGDDFDRFRLPIDIRKKYFECVNEVSCLDVETGLKVGCILTEYILFRSRHKEIIDNFIRYSNGVKFLIAKNKPAGATNYKPEGLLAKVLDSKNGKLIAEAFNNTVFLNYLYEGRLPAYSWSASSGEEMMSALTTGDYRKSYDAEKQLIKRVNREIYSKQPLGK